VTEKPRKNEPKLNRKRTSLISMLAFFGTLVALRDFPFLKNDDTTIGGGGVES